ncbi:MAG TPA: hypothetical protein VE863_11350 [Pyrinomonadaceae bacterium]|jgi:hypothetical protein|nr:hypothetical protein [Pyrinomonadaceae bacterium]
MKLLGAFIAVLACASLIAAQEVSQKPDVPPGLVVVKVKRERHREDHDVTSTSTDPTAMQNTGVMPGKGGSPTEYVYEYWLDLRNDSANKIRWLSWRYVLSDPTSKQELDRAEFVSFDKISAAQKKTVVGRKRFTLAGSADPKKKDPAPLDERVEFLCVGYDDGSLWHAPSVSEAQCRETDKRGKSN